VTRAGLWGSCLPRKNNRPPTSLASPSTAPVETPLIVHRTCLDPTMAHRTVPQIAKDATKGGAPCCQPQPIRKEPRHTLLEENRGVSSDVRLGAPNAERGGSHVKLDCPSDIERSSQRVTAVCKRPTATRPSVRPSSGVLWSSGAFTVLVVVEIDS
jgi:hypothetical protein